MDDTVEGRRRMATGDETLVGDETLARDNCLVVDGTAALSSRSLDNHLGDKKVSRHKKKFSPAPPPAIPTLLPGSPPCCLLGKSLELF